MPRARRIETLLATLAIGASISTATMMARAGRRPDTRPDVQLLEPRGGHAVEAYTGPRYEPSSYDRPNGYPHPRYGRRYRYRTDSYDVPRRFVWAWERAGE